MKLTIERSALLAAMDKAAAIADGRATIPILQHVALSAQGDTLTVRASNMDIEIVCQAKASIDVEGETTVQGSRLYDITRAAAEGADMVLTLDNRLAVKSGRSVYQLATLPIDTFPTFAVLDSIAAFEIKARILRAMLTRAAQASHTEKGRPLMNSVYLFDDGTVLGTVATDGKRLALVERETAGNPFGAIIPTPAVVQLARICGVDGDAKVRISEGRIMVETVETAMTAKLLGGDYVEFRRVIPAPGPRMVKVGRDALQSCARRMLLAADDTTRSVKLRLSAGSLALEARGMDAEGSDEISCSYDGDQFLAAFSGVLLAEAAGSFTDDVITWTLGTENTYPTIMTAEDEPGVTYVLMGQRV